MPGTLRWRKRRRLVANAHPGNGLPSGSFRSKQGVSWVRTFEAVEGVSAPAVKARLWPDRVHPAHQEPRMLRTWAR